VGVCGGFVVDFVVVVVFNVVLVSVGGWRESQVNFFLLCISLPCFSCWFLSFRSCVFIYSTDVGCSHSLFC